MRANLSGLSVLLVGVCLTACNQKDAAKCEQALSTVKQALAQENFNGAAQWREYAYKQCDDRTQLEALDQSIVRQRGEVEARTRAAEQRKTENRQLLKVFLQWVADNRAAPDKASAAPSCDPAADAAKEKAKERLCTASRTAGQYQLAARYWEAEPAIARFSVKLPDVATCEEIGASKVLKTWQVATTGGSTTARFRCEFPAGPLAGLNAVLSQAVNADLYVFNPSYLEKEPALRVILDGP
ncbi:MAG: hypothetical protein ACOY0T_25995 [Myxococcota bacterium]